MRSPVTALFLCAGDNKRWARYLGEANKCFIPIEGEPLIHRAVRLARQQLGDSATFYIVAQANTPRVPGTKRYLAKRVSKRREADKFLSSKELWSREGRTIVFYGDVWFSEEAMATICQCPVQEWRLFGRWALSRITGKPWGECFAQSFYPGDIGRHLKALRIVVNHRDSRVGGWEHYGAMEGRSKYGRGETPGPLFVEISDFTDDFDTARDYDKWLTRYESVRDDFAAAYTDRGASVISRSEFATLHKYLLKTRPLRGAVAEVGVFQGGSAKFICRLKGARTCYLCDTFKGMPDKLIGKRDNWPTGQHRNTSLAKVRERVQSHPNVQLRKGIFPQSAGTMRDERFSFVHLDVDLYRSTLDALRFFWPRMLKGGIIVSHNYNEWSNARREKGTPGVKAAFREFFSDGLAEVTPLNETQCVVVRGSGNGN